MNKRNNIYCILSVVMVSLLMTGCIKQVNLYQGDGGDDDGSAAKNEKAVFSDTKFFYSFKDEAPDKTAVVTLHLKKDRQVANLSAEMPPLKYNKEWIFMLTQDDCMQSAFAYTWAAIHGKPLSEAYYYDLAHLQEGDLPPDHYSLGKTLATTDGTGREVRFSFTTTLAAEEDFMNVKTNVNKGFMENYYRFYRKSGLVWGNVKEMMNYGVGIAFHDLKLNNEDKNTNTLIQHYNIAQNMILEKLQGRGCKMLAEPNGDKTYIDAAMNYAPIATMTAQSGAMKLKPFVVESDLKKVMLERQFFDTGDMVKEAVEKELARPKEERNAVYIGVHNTDTGWVKLLEWLNDSYGRDGDDTMWFPSQEEYYEYNYYRNNCEIDLRQEDLHTWKLTADLKGEEYFYYPSVTINIPGVRMEDIDRIETNDDITGMSYTDYKDGIMINIDCRKHLAEHAENFVKRYEADRSDDSNKADALYFVNMLKESDKKESLLKRLQ